MHNMRVTKNIPVTFELTWRDGAARGKACWNVNGVCFCTTVDIPRETVAALWQHMCRKQPYGESDFGGFLSRVKRMVSKKVARQVISAIKQNSLLPVAGKIANAIQKKTGLPVAPRNLSKGFDIMVAAASGNKAAIKKIANLGRIAAMGNPTAIAALYALKAVSPYVPAIRKVSEYVPQPPSPWQAIAPLALGPAGGFMAPIAAKALSFSLSLTVSG